MKILFLVGSAEPGKDGVGDYARRLAGELICQGHFCTIVALMDKGLGHSLKEQQDSEYANIPVLRLPFSKGYELNCHEAKDWVDDFNPDWISLQYVSFSFHPKGLPFGLSVAINKLIKRRKLQIMFHELWVGMNKEASSKHKFLGFLQNIMIENFVNKLQPSVIHTHTTLYQLQLLKFGVSANILPLFGNIPVVNFHAERKSDYSAQQGQKIFSIVIFGSIHYGAPIEGYAKSISKYAIDNNLDVEFIFVGRCGPELKHWITICELNKLKIKVLGEQPCTKISEILSMADLGITTTPLLLAQKSGTVAAMHEHGLPVLCVCRSWEVRGLSGNYAPFGIQLFTEGDLKPYVVSKKGNTIINSVSNISNQFLDSLLNFEKNGKF